MNLSRVFILRPIATSLLMFAILLVGIIAYQLLPVSALPEVDYPTIQISTFYPGASSLVMSTSVTAPLEKQFGQMPGLAQMTSTSSNGASMITLQFTLKTSLDIAEQEVQAAINAASSYLPTDLPNAPIYNKVNPADAPILTLALTSKTIPLTQIEDLSDTRLAQKISQVAGVGLVSISGGQRPAVRIQVNPTALAAYGLNLEDIRTSVAAQNVNTAKGSFDGPRLAYTVNANDQLLTNNDYASLIIAYKNGAPIRLSDVAHVVNGAENKYLSAWTNTTPAVILNIQRQPGANVIEVVNSVKKILPQLSASLPKDINISILSDRTVSIRESIKDVQFELALAIGLVVMVIFLFLRNLSATFIPSIAVPLSIIGTFAIMYQLGFTLNNLSLMALTVATGFVVDDAIVMIENISRLMEEGATPLEAALQGSKQIGFTILSLTISLIAALIPLLFMKDVIGRLFQEFALTLSITIIISAFVSLTLTPMLCAKFLRATPQERLHGFEKLSKDILDRLIHYYDVSLCWVLTRQALVLRIAYLTLALTAFFIYFIPKGFFPVQDTGIIQGISEAPQSISFTAMALRQQELAKVILTDPAVESLSSFIGVDGMNATLNSGQFLINLKPLAMREATASEIIKRLQTKLAAVNNISLFMQPIQNLSIEDRVSRNQYQLSINAPHKQEVSQWTNALLQKLKQHPELRDVTSDLQNNGLQTLISIDRTTASRFGITPLMIDNTLYDAFGQRQISTMFTQINQYHVILEAAPTLLTDRDTLNNLYINSVPLNVFTHISEGIEPLVVNRQGQFPVANISFNLAPGISLSAAMHLISQIKTELKMPADVQANFEGAAKIFQSSLANEGFLIMAAIIVIYIILGVLYESYIHPLTILSTLPSAGLGALLALLVTGSQLTVIALIGIILLIGIVMKNAIMMIDFALELERENNLPPHEAIYQACKLRFRPILMTTMASLFGAIPLAFGSGMGSELRQPLGIAIIGGLIVSQLLTLYTTPVIYLFFDRLAKRFSKVGWVALFNPT